MEGWGTEMKDAYLRKWQLLKVNFELVGAVFLIVVVGIFGVVFIALLCLAFASPVLLIVWLIVRSLS